MLSGTTTQIGQGVPPACAELLTIWPYAAERGRRGRSHGHADAPAGRCGCVQVVQPGETRDDARGTREVESTGERARNFEHTADELSSFMHISWHTRSANATWRHEDGLIQKGLFGRAAEI